jgi:hypothetical protein
VVQLLWKWYVVRRNFLLSVNLSVGSPDPWDNEKRESFFAFHVILAHLLPSPSPIQREKRSREEGIVAVS